MRRVENLGVHARERPLWNQAGEGLHSGIRGLQKGMR